MGQPQTNRATQALGVQSAAGTDPTVAYMFAPDAPGEFGPDFTRVPHEPLSIYNQREPGVTVDAMSTATLDAAATLDHLERILETALRCSWSTGQAVLAPTSATAAPKYVVPSGGALAAGTLVMVRGCAIAANNGVKVVDAGSDATNLLITTALTAETFTATQNVTIEVCGYQFTATDLVVNAGQNLTSTTKDFTELSLVAGQMVWIGGPTSATSFATAACRGLARVSVTPTANLITLEERTQAYSADTGTGKTVWLLFGRCAQVVPFTHARYIERLHTLETVHDDLSSGTTDAYEYVGDAALNTAVIKCPDVNKLTCSASFIGNNYTLTTTRKTAFQSLYQQTKRSAMSSATDIIRGWIKNTGSTALSAYIQSADLTIANGVERNTAHGVLGSAVMTWGKVLVNVAVQAMFTTEDAITALAGNDAVKACWAFKNDDGGIAFDIPEARLGGGKRSYPVNKVVSINLDVGANRDPVFNTSLIVSLFPYLPPVTI